MEGNSIHNTLIKSQDNNNNKNLYNLNPNNYNSLTQKKIFQKKLKYLYKKIDSISSLLWSHDNHITGKRLRSENDHEDNKTNWKNRETTQTGYGEIALGSMSSLFNLFQNISKLINHNSNKQPEFLEDLLYEPEEYNMTIDSNFLDIGSGFGKPVFHAAMQVGCYCRGVEVVPARVEFCLDFFYEFLNENVFFDEIDKSFFASFSSLNNEKIKTEINEEMDFVEDNLEENIEDNIIYNENIEEDSEKNKKENYTNELSKLSNEECLSSKGDEENREIKKINLFNQDIEMENAQKISLEKNSLIEYKVNCSNNFDNSENGNFIEIKNKNSENLIEENRQENKMKIDTELNHFNKDDYENNYFINKNNFTNLQEKINNNNYNIDDDSFTPNLEIENKKNISTNQKNKVYENNFQTASPENKLNQNLLQEPKFMFNELKKISDDSLINSHDLNYNFFPIDQKDLYNKKIKKKEKNNFSLNLKNMIKLNDLDSRFYNDILKEKSSSFYLELKINPDIIYEDYFIEILIQRKYFQILENNFNKIKTINNLGILVPEYPYSSISYGYYFIINEINIEITAIEDHLYSNVNKLIINCLYSDSIENIISKEINVFNENLKFDFIELTNKIENLFILDLINLTNVIFYVGKKNYNFVKIQEIINKSYINNEPDILEYNPNYLILNKSKFPFLQGADFKNAVKKQNNKENISEKSKEIKIKDLYDQLNKHLNDKNSIIINGIDNMNNNSTIITSKNKNNEISINIKTEDFSTNTENNQKIILSDKIKEKNPENKNHEIQNYFNINPCCLEDLQENEDSENKVNKGEEEKLSEFQYDTKILKEILVDFKYNFCEDWFKKVNFIADDATKYKSYTVDKKIHFSHIYAYNKLMSKECRSKIAKILNKTKFKVLAWYSNPKQTKKAGLKNFTFLSKFPMQSTSTEKFHVYVYIKTK